jgi:hypothetical protein
MNVTKDVVFDLLPVYAAGEASPDTVKLVEEYLRGDPELARMAQELRAFPLPEVRGKLRPTHEKEALNRTRWLLRLRGWLIGIAWVLTVLPFSFQFGEGGFHFLYLEGPPVVALSLWLSAASFWAVYYFVNRKLVSTQL